MVFHEFNSFTGRLKETMRFVPAMPIRPRLLDITEETGMMYDSIKTKPLAVKASTQANQNTVKYETPQIERLMKTKAFFCEDFSKPTYIYAGKRDKILLGFTLALLGIAMVESGRALYNMAHKK